VKTKLFIGLHGSFRIKLRSTATEGGSGECIVPRGVEHRTVSETKPRSSSSNLPRLATPVTSTTGSQELKDSEAEILKPMFDEV